jgi:hypothetical protein
VTYRTLLWTIVPLLLVAAAIGLIAVHGRLQVTLTQAEIQERVEKQLDKDFPISGVSGLIVKSARLNAVTIEFDDSKALVAFNLEGRLTTGKSFAITASAIGSPLYSSGEFFFKPDSIAIEDVTYEGGNPTEALDSLLQRRIRSERIRKLISGKTRHVEEWAIKLAERVATKVLLEKPVYRPKDDVKGYLVKASLESVVIAGDHLLITFSLWQLTITVVIGIACLAGAIVLAIALVRHPSLGAAFIFA